jgi:hypothetical protein
MRDTKHLPLSHPFRLVVCFPMILRMQWLADRNPGHVYSLHHGPYDGQTARFGCEGVNLIGALPHIAKEAFNGIGGANVAMHHLRKGVKREQMLFILHEAAHGFGIARSRYLALKAANCRSASSLVSDFQIPVNSAVTALRSRLGMAFISTRLFMHYTALACSGGKER